MNDSKSVTTGSRGVVSFLGASPATQVVTVKLQQRVGSRGQDWSLLTAGAFVSMLLLLAVFFSL
jgi:alpha-glucoside transport system permease protein